MGKKSANAGFRFQSLIGLICAATILMSGQTGVLAGEQSKKQTIPEKIEVNIQASCPQIAGIEEDKKKVNEFNHKLHAEKYLIGKEVYSTYPYSDSFTCTACHPGSVNEQSIIEGDKCERLSAVIEKNGGAKKYKSMMHAICQECHKKAQKAGQQSGPVKCLECHTK